MYIFFKRSISIELSKHNKAFLLHLLLLHLKEKTDLGTFTIFKDMTARAPPPLSPAIIQCTYIEEQGVVDSQRQFYMAEVSGAVAEVLRASGTHFSGVRGSQGQVVQPIYSRIAHVVQVLGVCYGFYTQLPEVGRKEQKSTAVKSDMNDTTITGI